jgi:hypothetical protein
VHDYQKHVTLASNDLLWNCQLLEARACATVLLMLTDERRRKKDGGK